MRKTIEDVMICPQCGSKNCYEDYTEEFGFGSDGTGFYIVSCCCDECESDFQLHVDFEYNVSSAEIYGQED